MIKVIILICAFTKFIQGSELLPWTTIINVSKQGISGENGIIFNEATENIVDGSVFVHQRIWHKTYSDNIMDESETGKILVASVYSIKGSQGASNHLATSN
jgi:hypothetical protein